jgi:hypothetical protein
LVLSSYQGSLGENFGEASVSSSLLNGQNQSQSSNERKPNFDINNENDHYRLADIPRLKRILVFSLGLLLSQLSSSLF